MRQFKGAGGIVAGLVLLIGVIVLPLIAQERRARPSAVDRQRWEYASLIIDAKAGGVRWVTPTESVKAGQFPKLCEEIGLDLQSAYKLLGVQRLPVPKEVGFGETTSPQLDRADHTVFCNHVGKEGWELAQHYSPAYTAPHGPADVWVFKRPAR